MAEAVRVRKKTKKKTKERSLAFTPESLEPDPTTVVLPQVADKDPIACDDNPVVTASVGEQQVETAVRDGNSAQNKLTSAETTEETRESDVIVVCDDDAAQSNIIPARCQEAATDADDCNGVKSNVEATIQAEETRVEETPTTDNGQVEEEPSLEISTGESGQVEKDSSTAIAIDDNHEIERECNRVEDDGYAINLNVSDCSAGVVVNESSSSLEGATVTVTGNEASEDMPAVLDSQTNDVMISSAIEETSCSQDTVQHERTTVAVSSMAIEIKEKAQSTPASEATHQVPDVRLRQAPAVALVESQTLEPFSDYQLASLYSNPELSLLENFIDDFVKDAKDKEECEFYELVFSYWKCRCALVKSEKSIEDARNSWQDGRDGIWETINRSLTVTRPCIDGIYVSREVLYKLMEFHQDKATSVLNILKNISGLAYEELLLRQYNSQMARIRIESYLSVLHSICEDFKVPREDSSVSGLLPRQLTADLIKSLCQLRDCISVLFMFKRRVLEEEGFIKDVDAWLQRLVGLLLHFGSLPDQFFVLNHVLRCPPGSVAPMAHLVQFPSFRLLCSNVGFWESPLVHHFIVMVATVTLRTRSRKEFLDKYKIPTDAGDNSNSKWTFVEEDREEDEDHEDCLYLLQENDLVALFEQLPIEDLFLYLLKTSVDDDGELHYDVSKFTSNDIARILAFGSCLVMLLGRIFDTYNYLRYRQFLKRVSQTVRFVVQLVSYHWSCYRRWRLESCGDSFSDTPVFMSISQQFSIARLQVEFDQFFFRGAHQIMSSKSAGAWQFLASMPYEAISSDAVVKVMSKFIRRNTAFTSDMSVESMLADINAMIPGEAIFLLSALSNMAAARPAEDKKFIQDVCQIEFEIAFVLGSTKDFCCKDGRDNLSSISHRHPFVMSYLLDYIQTKVETMKEDILTLFKVLPLHKWQPTHTDMNILRRWLTRSPITSTEHRLARLILKSLNFGTLKRSGSELFLSRQFHSAVALLLVDVYGCTFPNHAGGLALVENDSHGLIGQVSKLAVTGYNKIIHPNAQQEFIHWLWDVLLSLKLHDNDQPEAAGTVPPEKLVELGDCDEEDKGKGPSSGWFGKTVFALQQEPASSLDAEHSMVMLNMKRAVQSLGAAASYAVVSMSNIGHSHRRFLDDGMEKVAVLLQNSRHDAVLRLVSLVVPILVKDGDISMEIDGFFSLMDAVIHIDARQAGYAERVWQYPEPGIYTQQLAGIITDHVAPHGKVHSGSEGLARFWFSALTRVNVWRRDFTVQCLMDCLCKVVFSLQSDVSWFNVMFRNEFDVLVTSQLPRGLLSSVMSWIANANVVTLLDPKANSQWCYFAYYALCTETTQELECGLWREITDESLLHPKLSFEAKYKRAVSNVKASYIPPLEYLSIYRWADVALATHVDHPLLPLIWQKFFQLFLYRVALNSSGSGYKAGVGYQFFQAFHYSSKAKRMKAHLHATSAHHHEKSQHPALPDDDLADKTHFHEAALHERLSGLYQTLALWLEESRLHDAHITLETLPLVYWPDGLKRLFSGCQDPWMDYVDLDCIHNELTVLGSLWSSRIYHDRKSSVFSDMSLKRQDTASGMTDEQRLIAKLSRKPLRLPAPCVVAPSSLVRPVQPAMLLERVSLIQTANHDLERFVVFAKRTSSLLANHVALDEEYSELLPALYENAPRNVTVSLECHQRKRVCTGPAKALVQVSEPQLNDSVARMLHSNRDQWLQLVDACMQPLPQNLCLGAFHVERIVASLVSSHATCSAETSVRLRDTGIGLFYMLAQLIDDDVKRCHPAIQFFSSAVEVLGKEFIAVSGDEQIPLLESILRHNASVTCLAPFFSPNIYPERFPGLYSQVASSIDVSCVSKFFVLLSKFDVRDWLMAGPPIQDRIAMIKFIFSALRKFGSEPSSDCCLVLDLMRSHFQLLLTHRFPEIYSECLRQMVMWSAGGEICVDCWDDVIYCVGGSPVEHTVRRGSGSAIEPCLLKPYECRDTLQWFAAYFDGLAKTPRAQGNQHYRSWNPYIRHLTRLLFFLFDSSSSLLTPGDGGRAHEQACQQAWDCIAAIYSVWIAPTSAGVIWSVDYTDQAVAMFQSFVEAIRFTAERLQSPEGYSAILSLCWLYFLHVLSPVFAVSHVADVYFSLLPSLPWRMFWPSLQEIDVMAKLMGDTPLLCSFIATIIPLIPWQQLIGYYRRIGDPVALTDYHTSLFALFLRLAAKREAVATNSTKLGVLYESNDCFDWSHVKRDDLDISCDVFMKKVDPCFILKLNLFGRQTLGLIKYACAFKEPITKATEGKRVIYVRTIGRLLERCSTRKGVKMATVTPIVTALLKDVDTFASSAPASSHQEVHDMMVALLETSDSYQQDASLTAHIFNCIRDYIASSDNQLLLLITIAAAMAALRNVAQQVELSEVAISTYFEKSSPPPQAGVANVAPAAATWDKVAKYLVFTNEEVDMFTKEAVKQHALLCLYARNVVRTSPRGISSDNLDVIMDTVQWLGTMTPCVCCENKMVLLWHQTLYSISCKIHVHGDKLQNFKLGKYILHLAHTCQMLGEDRTYSGFLGVIGIGRKSALPLSLRFCARALHLFLLAQLPASGVPLRIAANSPGAIVNPTPWTSMPTQEAVKALDAFKMLLRNRSYLDLADPIEWVLRFVTNSETCLSNGTTMTRYFYDQFFKESRAVAAAIVVVDKDSLPS